MARRKTTTASALQTSRKTSKTITNRLNKNTNNGQVTINSDYTVNTESLVGKPSSYFQNNGATYPQQLPTIQNVNYNNNIEAQKQAQALQAQRDAVNQLLINGIDVLYGMNRTINGMTCGGLDYLGQKLGFDSQMNNYLQLKNLQERELAQNVEQYLKRCQMWGAYQKLFPYLYATALRIGKYSFESTKFFGYTFSTR